MTSAGAGHREPDRRRRRLVLGGLAAALAATVALGRAPTGAASSARVPADASEVVEVLRSGSAADPRALEVDRLRRALEADPGDVASAVRLARIYIRLARERADPRYLGRAEAVLARWWDDDAQPAVLVLRATIEQSLHEFDAALAHLDRALALAPGDVQGWLTRAVVLTVRGRHEEARASCARVATLGAAFAAEVCGTQVDSLTGAARPAHDRLAAAVERERAARGGISADEESWAESSLGEYAARFGDGGRAEAHFRRALELAPEDAYARAALADLWTDAGRFADAAALLAGREADDGMLLRLAIAEKRGGGARADEHDRTLAARFDASRARGDVVHRREEARFWLELRGDPARALELARANWTVQKEPWDVRVLLAAALATRRPDEAAPVLDWVRRSRLEDPAIARLAAELGR